MPSTFLRVSVENVFLDKLNINTTFILPFLNYETSTNVRLTFLCTVSTAKKAITQNRKKQIGMIFIFIGFS